MQMKKIANIQGINQNQSQFPPYTIDNANDAIKMQKFLFLIMLSGVGHKLKALGKPSHFSTGRRLHKYEVRWVKTHTQ